jgi:hypothetical protein
MTDKKGNFPKKNHVSTMKSNVKAWPERLWERLKDNEER